MISDNRLDAALHSFHRDPSTHHDPEAAVQRVLASAIEEVPQRQGFLPSFPKWRSHMFSALKFVAAGAIVALVGGFLLTGILTTQQGDEVLPAAVTESPVPASLEAAAFDGTMPYPVQYREATHEMITEDNVWTARGLGFEAQLEDISDPRLAGTYRNIINNHRYMEGEPNAYVCTSASRVDNADGSWLGHFTCYYDPDDGRWYHTGVMAGSGAYEGLSAIVFLEDTGASSYRVHGMILPDDMPEVPEYPVPAS